MSIFWVWMIIVFLLVIGSDHGRDSYERGRREEREREADWRERNGLD